TLQEHVFPMAYVILCLRFTLLVRLSTENIIFFSSGKVFTIHNLRTTRKTQYGWSAKPSPTGTFTLLVVTSLLSH
ncbi:MAG: hypothetical protein KUG82_21300, partial [Pseudomonadales bacterium]|nr:hypothetical protein [Pseudomonadales bacterium]